MPAADPATSRPGRVLRVHGLWSIVEGEDGRHYRCAVRRLLKNLVTDERATWVGLATASDLIAATDRFVSFN